MAGFGFTAADDLEASERALGAAIFLGVVGFGASADWAADFLEAAPVLSSRAK